MARKIFRRERPVCLSATVTRDADRALVAAFRAMAAARGLSVQQALLQAARDWLSELGAGQ